MKIRLLIGLLILSCFLVSCNREVASITTPAVSTSDSTATYPPPPVTIPDDTPQPPMQEDINFPQGSGGKEEPPIFLTPLDDRQSDGIVIDSGDTIELKWGIGYLMDSHNEPWGAVTDPEAPMVIECQFDGNGELLPGNKYTVENYWTDEIYQISCWTNTNEITSKLFVISVTIDTDALTEEEGEFSFSYCSQDGKYKIGRRYYYLQRDGKMIISLSKTEIQARLDAALAEGQN